jgi:hypothetical protein
MPSHRSLRASPASLPGDCPSKPISQPRPGTVHARAGIALTRLPESVRLLLPLPPPPPLPLPLHLALCGQRYSTGLPTRARRDALSTLGLDPVTNRAPWGGDPFFFSGVKAQDQAPAQRVHCFKRPALSATHRYRSKSHNLARHAERIPHVLSASPQPEVPRV